MVRLFVSNLVLLCITPRLWPPAWRLFVAARVWVRRLLLGLDSLDPCFGDELACRLLAALEALVVEIPQRLVILHPDSPPMHHGDGNIVVVANGVPWSLPLATRSRWKTVPVIPIIASGQASSIQSDIAVAIARSRVGVAVQVKVVECLAGNC